MAPGEHRWPPPLPKCMICFQEVLFEEGRFVKKSNGAKGRVYEIWVHYACEKDRTYLRTKGRHANAD